MSFVNIPGTDYAYLQENVSVLSQTNPVQNLRADSAFIAIAYGYGQYESYGYNACTSVRDLSQFIEVSNLLATVKFPLPAGMHPLAFRLYFLISQHKSIGKPPDSPGYNNIKSGT